MLDGIGFPPGIFNLQMSNNFFYWNSARIWHKSAYLYKNIKIRGRKNAYFNEFVRIRIKIKILPLNLKVGSRPYNNICPIRPTS
jgi:hypothetical protein